MKKKSKKNHAYEGIKDLLRGITHERWTLILGKSLPTVRAYSMGLFKPSHHTIIDIERVNSLVDNYRYYKDSWSFKLFISMLIIENKFRKFLELHRKG